MRDLYFSKLNYKDQFFVLNKDHLLLLVKKISLTFDECMFGKQQKNVVSQKKAVLEKKFCLDKFCSIGLLSYSKN